MIAIIFAVITACIGAVLVIADTPCECEQSPITRVIERASGIVLIVIGVSVLVGRIGVGQ